MAQENPGDALHWPATHIHPQSQLLQLVKSRDLEALTTYFSYSFPQLPDFLKAEYTVSHAVQLDHSRPGALLLAATQAESPEIFEFLWDTLYALQEAVSIPKEPMQIPFSCLIQAARSGNIPLARAFVACEPSALSRGPPPSVHGLASGSQIASALRTRHYEYLDFMRSQGVGLDDGWPDRRLLRMAAALEQTDEELEGMMRWLVARDVRIKGAGAVRFLARCGTVESVRVLLDAGADVEDLDDAREEKERSGDEVIESALMGAVREGNVDMVGFLVKRGANAGWKNNKGETPLSVADQGEMMLFLSS
ncbi:hypothetical protein B0J13DRAFT_637891 [Dactylonectria estremocensis]|uniref:Uncharacterized protein n=1 Tax=Dactylonectria estremocensis TaxID=1079267 RepID=A0A9P9EMV1_9HYPO|nr:hypothetical protein B0J13DRAFT_637891 [Dactylonectria estremocensis]